jgi:sensor histidine kinase YesM
LYGRYAGYLALQWLYGMLKLGPTTLIGYAILHYPFTQFALVEPVVLAAVGSYCWFVIELLDIKQHHPKLFVALRWLAYLLWAYSVVFAIISFAVPDMPFRTTAWLVVRLFLLIINLALLLFIAIRVKSSVKKYYLIGNFLFFFVSIIAGMHSDIAFLSKGYLNRLNTTTWYMISILLECIFFAFALGLRIKELQQTKQASDEKLIEQMQVNEKLIMETNQQLEQKVAERTEEIRRQAEQLEEVRLQETRAAYEKQLSETRMQALRSRMNPHFIFNSLNSIKYFILKKENDTAEFYLNKFSRLLRLILDYTTHETITLQQELEALQVYLEIESVRFDKSFHYHIHVDELVNPEKVNIPPLLLQPFVENAIWHGLANSEKDEKYCHVEITRTNGHVLMQIIDNGVGRAEAGRISANKPNRHISHGMRITDDRVSLFNNTNKGILNIQIKDNENDQHEPAGTTVNITFENP